MSISANFPNVRPSLLLDLANSQQLDPRVTFSRSTTAPYYGNTSVLAEQNLLLYSQAIGGTGWSLNQATANLNISSAPDGTTTATQFVENTTTASHYVNLASGVSFTSGLSYTFSVYMQVGNGATAPSIMQLWANSFITTAYVNFNISTGAVVNNSGNATGTITQVGSSTWYRCSMTVTATSTTSTTNIGIAFTNSNSSLGFVPSYLGLATSNVNLWGAQLEQRSSVTAYNATTTSIVQNYIPQLLTAPINAPRFDFNPTTGESLGLLIEQSSTNLLTYSQDFSNGVWTKNNATITSSANIAPDGTQTATQFFDNSTSGLHTLDTGNFAANTYTFSLYAKAGTSNYIGLYSTSTSTGVFFNLLTGTFSSNIIGAPTSYTINPVGNGWYRCSVTMTTTTSNVFRIIFSTDGTTYSYVGTGKYVFVWGAQLEALAFSTSYIPTTSAQVTRASDNASMTGTNFSSWFNQGQGTVYCESWFLSPVSGYPSPYSINDGTNNNRIQAYVNNSLTSLGGDITLGLVSQANVLATVSSMTSYVKSAFSFQSKVVNFAGAGVAGTTNTTANIPNGLNKLSIGTNALGNAFSIYIKKFSYYPIAVTSAQNQALTGS